MGKLYNKLVKAKYLNEYNPEYILEVYKRLSEFYDNTEIPFENVGLLEETQVKTHYNESTKTFSIAFECSRKNRVKTKFPIAIDWIINLMALPSSLLYHPHNQGRTCNFTRYHKVHAGFSIAFLKILDHIETKIKDIMSHDDIDHFEIYGWSYGGAMATLCHGWIANKYCMKFNNNHHVPTIITMTIGAPRTFFKIFMNIFKSKHWKYIKEQYQNIYLFSNANDIVTKIPFKFMSFTHVMPRIILEKPFNIKKVFQPNVYHLKSRYDELIINKLTQEIMELKETEIPSNIEE